MARQIERRIFISVNDTIAVNVYWLTDESAVAVCSTRDDMYRAEFEEAIETGHLCGLLSASTYSLSLEERLWLEANREEVQQLLERKEIVRVGKLKEN